MMLMMMVILDVPSAANSSTSSRYSKPYFRISSRCCVAVDIIVCLFACMCVCSECAGLVLVCDAGTYSAQCTPMALLCTETLHRNFTWFLTSGIPLVEGERRMEGGAAARRERTPHEERGRPMERG